VELTTEAGAAGACALEIVDSDAVGVSRFISKIVMVNVKASHMFAC
jgi:hypothetical protein